MTFDELGLSAPILEAVKDCGYEVPTPIQEQAIPIVLEGKDVIGASQTGTGKSAAFALPLLTKIEANGLPQVLVLEPTRELADQLAESFRTYKKDFFSKKSFLLRLSKNCVIPSQCAHWRGNPLPKMFRFPQNL